MPDQRSFTIERLIYGGDGLARVDGKVVFTPFVLPGETVHARMDRVKNDLSRAHLLQVVEPARARVTPLCPYFEHCGGCQYQHAGYEYQLDSKAAILREVLRRVGKINYDGGIGVIAGEPWHYRNRVQLHITEGVVGYFEHGSHRLCGIDHCPVSSPALNAAIAKLHAGLPRYRSFKGTVELFTNETDVQVNVQDRLPANARPLFDSIGAPDPVQYAGFQVSRNSFFQVNRFLVDRLVDAALWGLEGESAVDLYAGVGLFSLKLAEKFKQVHAVESSRSAFRDLEYNMAVRAASVRSEQTTAGEYLESLERTPDLIVADPPRTGLGPAMVKQLARLKVPGLVIIACDPATLARDLHGLVATGYRIHDITMVDLFPQTSHIETVVYLKRSRS